MFTTILHTIGALQILFIFVFFGITLSDFLVWLTEKNRLKFKIFIKEASLENIKYILYIDGVCILATIILFLV